MSLDNRTLVSKASIDSSALGSGGAMNTEQQRQFMTFMKDYSVFFKRTDVINMSSTTRYLDSLSVNKRALRAQVEDDDNPASGTADHKRRKLTAEGVIMPYNVTFQYMKENIEGRNVNTTLAKLFSQQFVNDSLDLAINGDTDSNDNFLSINDGWVKLAKKDTLTHKFDTEGSEDFLGKVFDGLLTAMPSKYFQLFQEEDKNLLTIFCSHQVNRKYKQQLQQRNTALGDSMIIDGRHVTYDGHEIFPLGFLPDNIIFLAPFENLAYGVFGQSLHSYHQVVPRKTRHEFTLLADFDMEIVNPDAFVIADNFTVDTTPTP